MQSFADTVESSVVTMRSWDAIVAPINSQYVLFFENRDSSSGFMPDQELEQAFYRALSDFPILAGRIEDVSAGRFQVVIDKDNLNYPVYKTSHSDVHFAELKSANFAPAKWPKGLESAPGVLCPSDDGSIKLGSFHIVRLADNSGVALFASICHIVVDGAGKSEFVHRWAAYCRQLRNRALPTDPATFVPLLCDRAVVDKKLLEVEPSETPTVYERIMSTPSVLASVLARLSLQARSRMIAKAAAKKAATNEVVEHTFHFSEESLERLRATTQSAAEKGARVSINDALTALIMTAVCQAYIAEQRQIRTRRSALARVFAWVWWVIRLVAMRTESQLLTLAIVVNFRHRLGVPESYTGNAQFYTMAEAPVSMFDTLATPTMVAQAAGVCRRAVDAATPGGVRRALGVFDRIPGYFLRTMLALASRDPVVLLNSHARFTFNRVDFGDGVPEFARNPPIRSKGLALVTRSSAASKALSVSLSLTRLSMENVLENRAFMDWCELWY